MIILAIETTSPIASIAIIDDRGAVQEESSSQRLSHLQNLVPMIDALLNRCRLQLEDIDFIAVSVGPGSFTGIRIGIATAKALAQALSIRMIPVPTLKAMAYSQPDKDGILCPMLDARRGQVYGGAYAWETAGGQKKCEEVIKAGAYMETELLCLVEQVREGRQVSILREEAQQAGNVAKLALDLYNEGAVKDFYDIKPDYMRKAEAEQKLEERNREK